MKPGNFPVIRFSHTVHSGIFAFADIAFTWGLFDGLMDFLLGEVDNPVSAHAVNPNPAEEIHGGLIEIVRSSIIRDDRIFPVATDFVGVDHIPKSGHKDLHIEFFFTDDRSLQCPLINI